MKCHLSQVARFVESRHTFLKKVNTAEDLSWITKQEYSVTMCCADSSKRECILNAQYSHFKSISIISIMIVFDMYKQRQFHQNGSVSFSWKKSTYFCLQEQFGNKTWPWRGNATKCTVGKTKKPGERRWRDLWQFPVLSHFIPLFRLNKLPINY